MFKDQMATAKKETTMEKKTASTLRAQAEEDTKLIAALREDKRHLQIKAEADAAKLGALHEVAQSESKEAQLEAELEASRNAWELQLKETKKVLKQQYGQKALELQTMQQTIKAMTAELMEFTSNLVVEKEESLTARTLNTMQTMATEITFLR